MEFNNRRRETYRHVGQSDAVIHVNGHLRFLDGIEIGAVDREKSATRSETSERLDFHDGRIFGVAERVLGQDALGVVDRHRQLGHRSRARRPRRRAQKSSARRMTAVDQTGQFVEESRNAAAHVQVETGDG